MSAATGEEQARRYPIPAYAWAVVILLAIAYALSLLDRWVLTLLVAPVKASLHVSDTAMGLLMGPIFALVYVFLGLPFGWIADRYNRRNLAAAAIGFWCLMTVLSGFSRSFGQLALCRFGIGFGEAALTPAATSIIADMFPRRSVNSAIGVFNLGIYTGMGLSYLIGGALVGWATAHGDTFAGGQLEPWQIVFVLVGAPGFLIAATLLIGVREPRRQSSGKAPEASMRACFAFLGRHRRAFVPLAVGMGRSRCRATAFPGCRRCSRESGVGRRSVSRSSTGSSCWCSVRSARSRPASSPTGLYAAGHRDAPYRVIVVGLPILVLVGGSAALWPSPYMTIAALGIAAFCSSMSTSAGVAAVVFATPAYFRGRMLALYTMTNSSIGTLLGPVGVGYLSDHLFRSAGGIRYALATVLLLVGGALTAFLMTGFRSYAAAVGEVEDAASAQPGDDQIR